MLAVGINEKRHPPHGCRHIEKSSIAKSETQLAGAASWQLAAKASPHTTCTPTYPHLHLGGWEHHGTVRAVRDVMVLSAVAGISLASPLLI